MSDDTEQMERLLYKKIMQDIVRGDPSNSMNLNVVYGPEASQTPVPPDRYRLCFDTPYFCMVEIRRTDGGNLSTYESYEWLPAYRDMELGRAIRYTFENLLSSEFFAYFIEVNNQWNFLINFHTFDSRDESGESERYLRKLRELLLLGCEEMERERGERLGAAISSVCSGWEQLPRLFREARRLSGYQVVLDYSTRVMTYSEVSVRSLSMEQKNHKKDLERKYLVNVMSNNYPEAGANMLKILDFYDYDSLPSVSSFSLQLMSLLSFALRSQFIDIYSNDKDAFGILACAKEIQLTASISAVRPMIEKLFTLMDQAAGEQSQLGNVRIESVFSYLRDHYRDPSLSITQVGAQAGITPQHLSRLLRQHTGMGTLETIHSYRIGEAKRLLAETDWTVKEIAENCGYENQWTFYRTFKKYEGVTPGEYRSIVEANQ